MDNPIRCGWCLSSDLYKEYHDQEWELLFMMMPLCLNSYFRDIPSRTQLDYHLNKRENFRKAFDNFDYKKIALFRRQDSGTTWTQESFATN
jgi:DNA-3-methyladenine glycosylase I